MSASLLTDLTALDLDTLDRTLEFLANNEAQIKTQVLPGDEQAGRYTLNEESLAAVQSFFNVSPTDGQGVIRQRAVTQHKGAGGGAAAAGQVVVAEQAQPHPLRPAAACRLHPAGHCAGVPAGAGRCAGR